MAAPAFRALGTFASGTTSCTPGLPAGHTTDDILVLLVECDDAETPNTPTDWTLLGSDNDGSDVKLTVFIKRHDGSETAPTVDGTSNHVHAWIAAYSGVDPSGSPWLLGSFTNQQTSTVTYAAITTTVADALVLLLTAIGDNANDTENLSGYTNANLASLTDRDDEAETTGTGGGLGFADGTKAVAESTGASTCTHDNAVGSVSVHLALYPAVAGGGTLTAESGSYSVTGTVSDADIVMPAASGSYAVTGTVATTFKSIILAAAAGAYALGGTDISFQDFPIQVIFAEPPVIYRTNGQGNYTPPPTQCRTYDDYDLLIIETADDPVTLATANGFTEHPSSPISVTGADGVKVRLTIFERLFNGTSGNPIVTAPSVGNHALATWRTFRPASGRMWLNLSGGLAESVRAVDNTATEAAEDTSGSVPGFTTTENDNLLVAIIAMAKDGGPNRLSGITNTSGEVDDIVEIIDDGGGQGSGSLLDGNLGAWLAHVPIAGDSYIPTPKGIGSTTFTWGVASSKAMFIQAINPGVHDATPSLIADAICSAASYFIFGTSATLRVTFAAEGGTYGVTGTDATLIPPAGGGTTLTADAGTYAIAGTAADAGDVVMPAASGSYTLSGTDATLTFTPSGDFFLTGGAEGGTYAVTGAGGGGDSGEEVGLTPPAPKDTDSWVALDDGARHWRFYGRYRRGMRRGNIH